VVAQLELPHELADDVAGDLGREARLAARRASDGLDDLLCARALHEVADRARLEHLEHAPAVFERRERDDPGARAVEPHLTRHARSAAGRHPHVHERDVGTLPARDRDGLLGVGGGADQLEMALGRDQVPEHLTQRRLVLRDHHADAFHRLHSFPRKPPAASSFGPIFGVGRVRGRPLRDRGQLL
jgi:hypothetical protein